MTLNLKIVTLVICFTKSQLEDIRSQMWEIRLENGRYKVIIASFFFLNFEAKAFFHNLLLYYSFLSEENVVLASLAKTVYLLGWFVYIILWNPLLATFVLKGLKCWKDAFEFLFGCVGDYSAFSHVLIHTLTITRCVVSKYDL